MPPAPHAVDLEQEPFSSQAGTDSERSQNNPLHCKTEDTADRWAADALRIVSAVYACARENRLPLIEATFEHLRAGPPAFATEWDAMAWARCWAEIASRAERKAYALACFETLAESDQRAFLACVTGRAAA